MLKTLNKGKLKFCLASRLAELDPAAKSQAIKKMNAAGVSSGLIAKIRTTRSAESYSPRIDIAQKICKILDIPFDSFVNTPNDAK